MDSPIVKTKCESKNVFVRGESDRFKSVAKQANVYTNLLLEKVS